MHSTQRLIAVKPDGPRFILLALTGISLPGPRALSSDRTAINPIGGPSAGGRSSARAGGGRGGLLSYDSTGHPWGVQ